MSVKDTITYIVIFIKINDVVKNPDEIDFRLVQAITSIFSVMAMKQRSLIYFTLLLESPCELNVQLISIFAEVSILQLLFFKFVICCKAYLKM